VHTVWCSVTRSLETSPSVCQNKSVSMCRRRETVVVARREALAVRPLPRDQECLNVHTRVSHLAPSLHCIPSSLHLVISTSFCCHVSMRMCVCRCVTTRVCRLATSLHCIFSSRHLSLIASSCLCVSASLRRRVSVFMCVCVCM